MATKPLLCGRLQSLHDKSLHDMTDLCPLQGSTSRDILNYHGGMLV